MKITKLTAEQKLKKEVYKNQYIDYILNNTSEVDIDFLKQYFAWFYKQFKINDNPPKVILCNNPMDMMRQIAKDKNEKLKYYAPTSYLNKYWTNWIAYYDFFDKECFKLKKSDLFNKYRELFTQNISYCVAFQNAVYVSKNATKYLRDADKKLHSVYDMAVQFEGWGIYKVHGVTIPKIMFQQLTDRTYTFEQWVKESNEEVKTAALSFIEEFHGNEALFHFISDNLSEVDTFTDKKSEKYLIGTTRGMNIGVYTLFKNSPSSKLPPIAFVRCYCPSTDRMFFLSVHPDNKNAKDAIASLYRVPKKLVKEIKNIARQGERFSTIFTDRGLSILKQLSESEVSDLIPITGDEYFSKMTYEF